MENLAWILWSVLGVILIVAETFTLGFVLFWFGIGAFAAALVGFLGFGYAAQFVVFAVVSLALTIMSRTIFANYFSHNEENAVKTGIDALPGKIGTVTAASRGALNEAAVKVYGSVWTAYPIDEETIFSEGEKVEVVSIKGSSIYVRRLNRELPDWREKS